MSVFGTERFTPEFKAETLRVTLDETSAIRGQVVDQTTNRPVSGGLVSLAQQQGEDKWVELADLSERTKPDGSFAMFPVSLEKGKYRLRVYEWREQIRDYPKEPLQPATSQVYHVGTIRLYDGDATTVDVPIVPDDERESVQVIQRKRLEGDVNVQQK